MHNKRAAKHETGVSVTVLFLKENRQVWERPWCSASILFRCNKWTVLCVAKRENVGIFPETNCGTLYLVVFAYGMAVPQLLLLQVLFKHVLWSPSSWKGWYGVPGLDSWPKWENNKRIYWTSLEYLLYPFTSQKREKPAYCKYRLLTNDGHGETRKGPVDVIILVFNLRRIVCFRQSCQSCIG